MFSFKKWAASASAACLLLSLSVAPLFSQAAAEQKSPQAKTKAEYDAYMLLYNEAAPAKKAELAGKFLTDHPETEFKMFVYQMQIDSYARLQPPNVDKVVETGEKFEKDFPQADNATKKFVMQRMMTAYQQKNDFAKTVEYGDKLLTIDPKDLPSLLTLSSILPERLPTEEDKKGAQLDKALDYANRAKAETEALPKPAQGFTDEQWTTEKNKLLATVNSSIGLVHLNKKEYEKASQQYEISTKLAKTNPIDFYRLGVAYTFLARNKAKELNDLVAAMNQAQTELQNAQDAAVKDEKQKKLLELKEKSQDSEKQFPEMRDKAIDSLAKSVFLKGITEASARTELERLYKSKNNNTLDGLDTLIAQAGESLKKPAQ